MFRKNDEFEAVIEDLGMSGEGIGRIDGYTLFIKDAVIGDVIRGKVVKAGKNYGYGRVVEIITPSPYRVEPVCPVARQCGGCQIQALAYEKQLEYKENKIKNNLERIGKVTDYIMEPIIGMEEPYFYRNKAQFPVGRNKDGDVVIGFYAGRTHSIIETEKCYINHEVNERIIKIVKGFIIRYGIEPYNEETHTGLVRHILTRIGFRTGEVMVCLIINGKKLPYADNLVSELMELEGIKSISINVNREKSNVILGNEIIQLYGDGFITDYIGDVKFQISPLSFYQVNPVQTEKLYRKALEYAGLSGNEVVWDLYCGIGTISLFLAQKAKKVYGVEIVPQAVADARKNAEINGIQNVEFFVGKAEEVVPEFYREKIEAAEKMHDGGSIDEFEMMGVHPDVIVVDPPRKGCEEALLETIAKMAPEKVVYVSCDSATLARDVKWLGENGYQVEKVCGCDLFGGTVHVETCVLLSHKKPDSHINIKVEFGEGEGKVPLDRIAERAEAYKPKERIITK